MRNWSATHDDDRWVPSWDIYDADDTRGEVSYWGRLESGFASLAGARRYAAGQGWPVTAVTLTAAPADPPEPWPPEPWPDPGPWPDPMPDPPF
jgi:hypothetical protein